MTGRLLISKRRTVYRHPAPLCSPTPAPRNGFAFSSDPRFHDTLTKVEFCRSETHSSTQRMHLSVSNPYTPFLYYEFKQFKSQPGNLSTKSVQNSVSPPLKYWMS